MSDITLMLQAAGRGESGAAEELLPLVYEELRRLATARMVKEASAQTLQATALVHEAWLRLVGSGDRTWQNRAHFFAAAAEAMRRILIERARRRSRLKRGGGQAPLNLDELEIAAAEPDERVLLIDEALDQLRLQDPRRARVVVLKFFGGMTNEEVAEVMGISERNVRMQWNYARAWLYERIQSEEKS